MKAKADIIHHIALQVNDIPRFTNFFTDVFGMQIYKTRGEEGAYTMVWLDGGIQLVARQEEHGEACPVDHIGILVTDLQKIRERAERYGAQAVPGKDQRWFRLPEGIVFELMIDPEGIAFGPK